MHQLDRFLASNKKCCLHLKLVMRAFKNAVALTVAYTVLWRCAAERVAGRAVLVTGGQAQKLAGLHVLQQVMLMCWVLYRVIAPRGDLVLAAVGGPGVTAASLRHLKAKRWVGNHVHPWARWPLCGADVELKLASGVVEFANWRRDAAWRGQCLPQGQLSCFGFARLALLMPRRFEGCHLRFNGSAVGNQHHPRHGQECGLFRRRHLMLTQQMKARRSCRRKAVLYLMVQAVALGHDVMLQRRQIRVVLTVEHHHIGSQCAKAPPGLRTQQRMNQPQAFGGMDVYQQDGFVARNAKPPQMLLVDERAVRLVAWH